MSIIEALDYQVRKPSAAQVAMQHMAATRAGAWFFAKTLDDVDKALLRLSRGHVTLPGALTGLPVLTVTTTGARTGQRRSAPEVTYRDKTVRAIAREAEEDERQAIWNRARTIYIGYEAYASRIKTRQIHIMVLGMGQPPAP